MHDDADRPACKDAAMLSNPIAAGTTLGPVRLLVADLPRVRAFYERALGLSVLARDDEAVALGPAGGAPLVELTGRADAPPRARGASGLFHLALLYPSRLELARALRRVAAAHEPLTGASDHLVSEALYLADPEGNGIELYRDRPREEWRRADSGELAMATLPLDLDGLVAELADDGDPTDAGAPAGTTMGHVHLEVAELPAAERFYGELLGFETMVRGYPGALFLAAGGYHHHIGLNTWGTRGGPPNAPGSRGLRRLTIVLPDAGELERVAARLAAGGVATRPQDGGGLLATDPSGDDVLLQPTVR
jgi:catechol 2,3-dioxygenase